MRLNNFDNKEGMIPDQGMPQSPHSAPCRMLWRIGGRFMVPHSVNPKYPPPPTPADIAQGVRIGLRGWLTQAWANPRTCCSATLPNIYHNSNTADGIATFWEGEAVWSGLCSWYTGIININKPQAVTHCHQQARSPDVSPTWSNIADMGGYGEFIFFLRQSCCAFASSLKEKKKEKRAFDLLFLSPGDT